MTDLQPITLMNTGLPLTLLGAIAFILPRMLLPRQSRSHWLLTSVLLFSCALTLLAAIVIFGYIQVQNGTDLAGSVTTDLIGTAAILIRPALLSGIVWLPMLILSGFGLSHRVENLRGRDLMQAQPQGGASP